MYQYLNLNVTCSEKTKLTVFSIYETEGYVDCRTCEFPFCVIKDVDLFWSVNVKEGNLLSTSAQRGR
jgi:hypothetical protein